MLDMVFFMINIVKMINFEMKFLPFRESHLRLLAEIRVLKAIDF